MAGVMRDRSRTADDRLERLARRFTRRAARIEAADTVEGPAPPSGTPSGNGRVGDAPVNDVPAGGRLPSEGT